MQQPQREGFSGSVFGFLQSLPDGSRRAQGPYQASGAQTAPLRLVTAGAARRSARVLPAIRGLSANVDSIAAPIQRQQCDSPAPPHHIVVWHVRFRSEPAEV